MADEFDACECVWSHQLAVQRLLNFIRQNQNACTDTHCIDVTGRLTQNVSTTDGDDNNYVMMTMLMLFAVIMYMIRPESIMKFTNRKRREQGPYNGGNGGPNQPPPPSPPAIN